MTSDVKILTLREYSLSYQNIFYDDFITRANLLDEIEEIAEQGNKIIVVEGNEGIGKTNILLQFAKKHHFNCFTYFINNSCRATAKPEYLIEDIGKQILFYLHSDKISEDTVLNEGVFNNLQIDLIRHPIKKDKKVYFVIDGIDQIEKSEVELIKPLLLNLPWAINNFYFIISGSVSSLTDILSPKIVKKFKSFRVIRFSYEETLKFFNWEDSSNAKEVHDTWNGHPERLSQIKRILDSGVNIEDFLKNDFREKDDLLEIEWQNADLDRLGFISELIKVICIISFDDTLRNVDKILRIIDNQNTDILNEIGLISFLKIRDNEISFVSNSYRQYVSKKLSRYETQTFNLLIGFYKEQDEISLVQNLPLLFDKKQEWSSIIELLTVNNLSLLVSNSKSFADIKRELNFGYKASNKLKKDFGAVFKFALYRSLVNGLQKSDVREAQLEAYIALDKQGEIFSLISKAVLKEDRLRMLIKYAKESKIQDFAIDPIFIQEIQDKVEDLDQDYLKENIIEIATGLAYFLPKYAVKVIEKVVGPEAQEGSLELLINYIAHITGSNIKEEESGKGANISSIKMGQTFGDQFAESIGYGMGDLSETEIIDSLINIDNVSDRLYLAKVWIRKNSTAPNIVEVMEYAVNVLLQSSSTIKPTTTSLLDIFKPLLFLDDLRVIRPLIARLDELMTQIDSPTNDRIKLSLLIVQSLAIHDVAEANARILELYEQVHATVDYASRIEGFANCWSLLRNLSALADFSIDSFILDERDVESDINKSIDEFLLNCADHFGELEETFKIIPRFNLEFSVAIAGKLNTLPRRSLAFVKCIEVASENKFTSWNVQLLKEIFGYLSEPYYSKALSDIIHKAFDHREDVVNNKDKFLKLVPLIDKIQKYSLKCFLIGKCVYLLSLKPTVYDNIVPSYKKTIANLKLFLERFWVKIDDPIVRINIGYFLVAEFRSVDRELAEYYFEETESFSNSSMIDNRIQMITYIESIRLYIRVFSQLLGKDGNYPYNKLGVLLDYLPSDVEKISLWSEFSMRTYFNGNRSVAEEIVNRKILPILNRYSESDYNYSVAFQTAASAIYFSQRENFKLLIKPLSAEEREGIVGSVCFSILARVPVMEPFEEKKGFSEMKFEEASEYIYLLDHIDTDTVLFQRIKTLSEVAKKSPNNFSREQKIDIRRRLLALIAKKYPNTVNGIKHEGYSIVSKAAVTHFNINKPGERVKEFDDLEVEANKIPNVADRAFTLVLIARECSVRKKKLELLLSSCEIADKIASMTERLSLYEQILEELSVEFNDIFKQKILGIQTDIMALEEADRYRYYKSLVDLAFRHDKQLALRLLSALDADPGRKQLKGQISDHYDHLELEKVVQDDYSKIGRVKNRRSMGNMVYKMLGELNSGNRKPKNLDQTIQMVYTASVLPFFYSLPLFEFFIENLQSFFPGREGLLIAMSDHAYSNARLCYNLITSISNKNYALHSGDLVSPEDSITLKPGMRDKAFEFIEKFVRSYAKEEIYILDSYFSHTDIGFIRDLVFWANGAAIYVLTSSQSKSDFSKSSFLSAWKKNSSESPPNCTFVSVSNEKNESTFHDRWLVLPDVQKGLFLGSSINSLGLSKVSSISTLHPLGVETTVETVINPFIKNRQKIYEDQKVKYEMFEF